MKSPALSLKAFGWAALTVMIGLVVLAIALLVVGYAIVAAIIALCLLSAGMLLYRYRIRALRGEVAGPGPLSSVLLAIIYFGLFAPIAAIIRWSGRDLLQLDAGANSYWVKRSAAGSKNFHEQL